MGKKKKASVGYFIVFIFLSLILLILFAFGVPLMINMETSLYTAGEIALDDAQDWINKINDTTVKAQIQDTLDSSKSSIPDQIDVLGFFYQYAWLIIIVVILFIIFMQTRQTVETEIR